MAKAFDSVSHDYLKKVYSFFNFGERIQRWLTSIGTNRKAQIILADGSLSDPFHLKRGTAQGDSPSPFIYNLAAQILILKIELSSQLKGLFDTVPDPLLGGQAQNVQNGLNVQHELNTEYFAYESLAETTKNESFADDAKRFSILKSKKLFASSAKDSFLVVSAKLSYAKYSVFSSCCTFSPFWTFCA